MSKSKNTTNTLLAVAVALIGASMIGADESGCEGTSSATGSDGGSTVTPTGEAPTEADVKKAFKEGEEQYDSVNHRWVVTVANIRFGTPRIGDWYKDGTPQNKETTVYPVKLNKTTTNKDKTSGAVTSTTTDEDVTASFFRDDFNAWTYRLSSGGG